MAAIDRIPMDIMEPFDQDNSPPSQARNVGLMAGVIFGAIASFLFGLFVRVPDMINLWAIYCLAGLSVLCGWAVHYVMLEGYPLERYRLRRGIMKSAYMIMVVFAWLLAGMVAWSLGIKTSEAWFTLSGIGIVAAASIYFNRGKIAGALHRWGLA